MQFTVIWRILTSRGLLCLLVSQALIMSMPAIFDANNSFLLEGTYGWSSTHCAMIMGSAAILGAIGAFFVDKVEAPVTRIAQFTCATFVLAGVVSIPLGILMNAWGYILGTFLQALLATAASSAVSALYFERMDDCAGMAAAYEVFIVYVPPSLISAVSTVALVTQGEDFFVIFQASMCMLAGLVFLVGSVMDSFEEGCKSALDAK